MRDMPADKDFLDRFSVPFFIAALLFVIVFSVPTLTTKPKLWMDEAKSMELARNFLHYGKLDIATAPGQFTGFPSLLQSTGYPVTVPLALVFKIFGYGIVSARIFMLAWMLAALGLVFWLGKKIFTPWQAGAAVLLIATFSSFHDSGRTVVGEVPGFLFLLLALRFFLKDGEAGGAGGAGEARPARFLKNYFLAGIFMGFAVVTKPSVFATAIPAVFITFAFEKPGWRIFLERCFTVCIGMVPAALLWFMFVVGSPFTPSVWQSIFVFYKNPYGSSIAQNVISNLKLLPRTATLVYFVLLLIPVTAAAFWEKSGLRRVAARFTVIYAILAFIYYLRSPGWIRYMVIADFLILFVLPAALAFFLPWLFRKFSAFRPGASVTGAVLVILVAIQIFRFFHGANIYYSDSAIAASDYVNTNFPGQSVGTLNLMEVHVLLNTERRFPVADFTGMPLVGSNPLFTSPLPDVVVSYPDNRFLSQGAAVIAGRYALVKTVRGINIYKATAVL